MFILYIGICMYIYIYGNNYKFYCSYYRKLWETMGITIVGGPYNYGPSRHCRVTPETDTEHIFQEVCSIVFST